MAEKIQKKDIELTRKSKISSQLQQEVEKMKAELYHGHTSWEGKNSDLKMRLESSEEARENLLQQVTELTRKLTHHSAQIQGQMGALVELEKAGLEIQRLRNTVKKETSERQKMEMAVLKYKGDLERLEGQYKEVVAQKEVSDKRRLEERAGREACEEEGRELRKEVQTLSEDLRVSHQLLRTEAEKREEKEKNGEDSLTHLQQELTKRAQQVRNFTFSAYTLGQQLKILINHTHNPIVLVGIGDGQVIAESPGRDHSEATPIGAHPLPAPRRSEGEDTRSGRPFSYGQGRTGHH